MNKRMIATHNSIDPAMVNDENKELARTWGRKTGYMHEGQFTKRVTFEVVADYQDDDLPFSEPINGVEQL